MYTYKKNNTHLSYRLKVYTQIYLISENIECNFQWTHTYLLDLVDKIQSFKHAIVKCVFVYI